MVSEKRKSIKILKDLASNGDFYCGSRGLFKGKRMLIISCGPSARLLEHLIGRFNLSNTLILCVKQASRLIKDPDIIVYNSYNVSRVIRHDEKCFVVYGEGDSIAKRSTSRGAVHEYYDLKIRVSGSAGKGFKGSFVRDGDTHSLKLRCDLTQLWGPGIIHEVVLPLAIHLGVEEVDTIGWDIFFSEDKNNHFYDSENTSSFIAPKKFSRLVGLWVRASKICEIGWKINSLINYVRSRFGLVYNRTKPKAGESLILRSSLMKTTQALAENGISITIWTDIGGVLKPYKMNN